MKSRPILFSGPMVRALLDGTKTQTRRIFKAKNGGVWPNKNDLPGMRQVLRNCPYGQPGDQLWVRETWNWFDPDSIPTDRAGPRAIFTGNQGNRSIPWVAAYAADGHLPYPGYEGRDHWRPSIHMPRWASRITLEITGVRVERLQEINETDASAEGVDIWGKGALSKDGQDADPSDKFRWLWGSINGPDSWSANPWVWVVEFKKVQHERN